MNDLEIIERCAAKAGIDRLFKGKWSGEWNYNPLRDDAEAMQLVKKFRLSCVNELPGDWIVRGEAFAMHTDLNRAICECVAKLPD